MIPKLYAFDLDGTLLTGNKQLSPANERALLEIAATGGVIVLASGRLGSSMRKIVPASLDEVAMLTLNGAAVYMGARHEFKRVYYAPLSNTIADYLIDYVRDKPFVLNYYADDKLFAVRNEQTSPWIDLYYNQTKTTYYFENDLDGFRGRSPAKIIFVGEPSVIDEQERFFRELWGDTVYICRTWDYYLEFLDVRANKASGLEVLANEYHLAMSQVAAFGDANNDIPMLRKAGLGIAMANAPAEVKRFARRVSPWTNDEDGIAREWEEIKKSMS